MQPQNSHSFEFSPKAAHDLPSQKPCWDNKSFCYTLSTIQIFNKNVIHQAVVTCSISLSDVRKQEKPILITDGLLTHANELLILLVCLDMKQRGQFVIYNITLTSMVYTIQGGWSGHFRLFIYYAMQ